MMNWLRHALPATAGLAAALGAHEAAAAGPFKDQLVQPPSIAQPERGSIAGSLSRLAFGPSALARGAYSLPLPIDAPAERGGLLASVVPSYSAEGGVGEWGVGWQTDLTIRRHRVVGEIDFTAGDSFTSPWGRLVEGDDGAYYPAGLRSMVRLRLSDEGWVATTSDGTRHRFDAADASVTPDGTYSWNLSRVETLFGDSTTLTWTHNDTGRAFLSEVRWGGRFDGNQYRMTFTYEPLSTPFATFVSGAKTLLDRRVTRVAVSARNGAYLERYRYDLTYQTSPTGPAFYLASVTKRYASGATEPPVTYRYDFSTDQLANATFQPAPALDGYLATYGSGAIQPDKAAMTDLERNGLTDMEVHLDQTLVRQTETGYVFEALPAPTGAENPLCRPAPSATNKPRFLARMHGDATEPNVVVTAASSTGAQTRVIVCDRAGFTQLDQWITGAWATGPNTRLADLDLDQRPDIVRVSYGSAQVLRNTSISPAQASFAPGATSSLLPRVTPTASWVLDVNGDGRPDLMVRHSGGVVVWRGVGSGRFEQTGTSYLFTTASGLPLSGLSTYEFSHGDFNNDGLSDLILTKGQTVLLFTNRGSSFVETPVSAFASIPWSVSFPVVVDLSGSGNEQIVMANGAHAEVLQLSRPSTGLLLSSDDGKGTVVHFGYGRVRPAPGVNQLYSILTSMRVESSGYDPVTYTYEYGSPVWHTAGKYLVGFEEARKASPYLHETVAFHNDNDIAGVVTGTRDEDDRIPGLVRFSERGLEPAAFHGVPWLRVLWEERGWQAEDGSAAVTTRTDFREYHDGICPTVVETTGPDGIGRQETTLMEVAELDPELVCLTGSQRVIGTHDDATLDYDYRVDIERDDFGRVTRASQAGPTGPIVLQEVAYDDDHRVASIGSPGAGTSFYTYDPVTGQLSTVTSPDGVVESVVGRDPITDALVHSRITRGGAAWNNFADHDGLERLRATWDDLSGATPARPLNQIDYVWATAAAPGQILERHLVDAATGAATEMADLLAADGAVLAKAALQPGGYSLSRVTQVSRSSAEVREFARDPMPSLGGLTHASLLAGATLLGVSQKTGAGSDLSSWSTVQSGVISENEVIREIVGDELVVTAIENGAYATRTGAGADGRPRWFEDQSGAVTSYAHDAMGRLRRVYTPAGVHSLDFDAYGRPSVVQREDVQRVEWSYAAETGRMTERRELSTAGVLDRRTRYEHDAIGRITRTVETKSSSGETRTVETGWDGALPGGLTLPGQLGFATTVTTGEITKVTTRRADGKVSATRWDLDGWRKLDQDISLYANGATKSVTLRVSDRNDAPLLVTTRAYDYDAYGRLVSCRLDGALLFTMTYDGEGRPETVYFADGALDLSYDPMTRARRGYEMSGSVSGAVSWEKNARGLMAAEIFELGDDTLRRGYRYDARGFLVGASDGAGSASYSYDASGLIASASDELGDRPIARSAAAITAGGESYQVDAMGRVTAHDDLTVEYGPSGDVERAYRGADELRFAYDEAGQRVLKYRNGVPVAGYVAGAYLSEDGLVEPVNVAGITVGVIDNGVFERLPFDPRGTSISDEAGALSLASAYGARIEYGPLAEAIDYVQKGYDRDLGLVRMGVRDYDPLLGQFWTPDPLFLTSIDKCVASPAECNLYGYARNNPVSYVDPTGTDADNRRTPPELEGGDDKRVAEMRAKTGLRYENSHALAAGDRVISGIDYAITLDSIKQRWDATNGEIYYRDWGLWTSSRWLEGSIPQRDLNEIDKQLRTFPTGVGDWTFTTSNGYEVRIMVITPIAGTLSEASMTSGTSEKITLGMTFKEYTETATKSGANLGLSAGDSKTASANFGTSYEEATKSGTERTSQSTSETGRSANVTYKFSHQAESAKILVGVWKSGKQGVWTTLATSHEGSDNHLIQHAYVPIPGGKP
ncbi:RHS repeat-associated core domain-containing protein [Sorangium sp. So ce295]|uniref:RHS repeat-associated core domain-containing protein n=1 Tax=Sorangium sp. So ce295 TaxID=3133295 RepID=UPI003F5D7973